MPPLYRLVEVGIYSLLNFLPLMVLALYPFRHRLRFSKTATVGLVVALSLGLLGKATSGLYSSEGRSEHVLHFSAQMQVC